MAFVGMPFYVLQRESAREQSTSVRRGDLDDFGHGNVLQRSDPLASYGDVLRHVGLGFQGGLCLAVRLTLR